MTAPSETAGDRLVASIPLRFTDVLGDAVHLHQFPLVHRQLQVPPSAELAGKRIHAARKPECGRMQIHLPLDVRPDVWNNERGYELGNARAEADAAAGSKPEGNPVTSTAAGQQQRLNNVRLRSERVPAQGQYMIGVLRDDVIYLHPISQTHQFKPHLDYLDHISRTRSSRKRNPDSDDEEDDDGPPPDPDEAPPPPKENEKKAKTKGEVREVTVTAKKTEEKGAMQWQGGLSSARREMLAAIRKEEEEEWQQYDYCGPDSIESQDVVTKLFDVPDQGLVCDSTPLGILKAIGELQRTVQ